MKDNSVIILLLMAIAVLAISLLCKIGIVESADFTDEQICDAIFLAEGGNDAIYLYGIRSVSYDTPEEAREICLRTIRNNRKRYADYGHEKYDTYLEFLQSRYCPINCDNDRGENKFWLGNVLYFLNKG